MKSKSSSVSYELITSIVHITSYLSTLSFSKKELQNSNDKTNFYKKQSLLRWKVILKVLYSFRETIPIYKEVFEENLQLIITSRYCNVKEFMNILPNEMQDCLNIISYLKLIK